jgi:hypothetical protein
MLAGQAPFKDTGAPALINAHLNVLPPPIAKIAPEVPNALDRAVLRALAKQPDDRYPTMRDFGNALVTALRAKAAGGLVNLEFDPEIDTGATEIGMSLEVDPATNEPAPTELDGPTHVDAGEGGGDRYKFDDATVKMDRPPGAATLDPARTITGPFAGADSSGTRVMYRSEEPTATRTIPEELLRVERAAPRACAMCHTINAPHARACSACGVSLAASDQDAVRARVQAPPDSKGAPPPRTAHLSAPEAPPPMSGAYGSPVNAGGPGGYSPYGPPPGPPLQAGAWGSGTTGPAPVGAASQPTMWQRFLRWAGIR